MAQKLTLEGEIKKSCGRMDYIENPRSVFSQVYIPLTDIQVRVNDKDHTIENIRGNPNFEAGDKIRLHFERLGADDTKSEADTNKFMEWLERQETLFPCKIEKLRAGNVVYEHLLPYNNTKYANEGYCPNCD